MSVIPITLFFSLLLAGTFVVLFARDHRRRRFGSAERDSLLPLADEQPVAVEHPGDHHEPDHDHHDHAHDHTHAAGNCGCRDGSRPPCTGCLRRRTEPASLSS